MKHKFSELDKLNEEISNILDSSEEVNQLDQMYFDILFEEFDEQVANLKKSGVSSVEILEFLRGENKSVSNPKAKEKFLELCESFENFGIKTDKDKTTAN